eukprot:TRINITY_DN16946_c0_g1_i4.p1 TRINITY_DN16946_c0_g1~~TRINITY_DN16946_c0_g1_i4.p1  ORF type:complete len:100 (+),score=1.84 TRINITY_DN16946_c0_g1_i4:239-538(+)
MHRAVAGRPTPRLPPNLPLCSCGDKNGQTTQRAEHMCLHINWFKGDELRRCAEQRMFVPKNVPRVSAFRCDRCHHQKVNHGLTNGGKKLYMFTTQLYLQ